MIHSYTDGITHERIAILGIYPPPWGGVSVHVKRTYEKLLRQNNTVRVFNTEPRGRYKLTFIYLFALICWLVWYRPRIVIYHSVYLKNSIYELMALSFFMRICNVRAIFVDHDPRHLYKRTSRFVKRYRALVARVHKIVCIGMSTYQQYCARMPQERALFVPESAFLPPDLMQERALQQHYPEWVASFIGKGSPLIVANAGYVYRPEGSDIYGMQALVDLFQDIVPHFPHARMIIAVGAVGDNAFFNHLNASLDPARCAWLIGNYELWPIVRRAHLFVRPTLSDGESISVQEALYFGTPVVASDAVERPAGVHLYKTGDRADLLRVSRAALTLRSQATFHANSCQSYS